MAASVEAILDLWSSTLRDGKGRFRPLFGHPSVADAAVAFLDVVLGPERRKTGWIRAEAAGDEGPWRRPAHGSIAPCARVFGGNYSLPTVRRVAGPTGGGTIISVSF